MTTTKNEPPVCKTCGKSHPYADGTVPKHPFNDGTLSFADTFGAKLADGSRAVPMDSPVQVVEQAWPFDPVLRQALIDKGILTTDDLTQAERKIRLITNQFKEGQ